MTQQTTDPSCGPLQSAYLRDQQDKGVLREEVKSAMVGKVGLVTGTLASGQVGEVMLTTSGGSEAFHAYASNRDEVVPVGTRVLVIEYFPPRTVVVQPM